MSAQIYDARTSIVRSVLFGYIDHKSHHARPSALGNAVLCLTFRGEGADTLYMF